MRLFIVAIATLLLCSGCLCARTRPKGVKVELHSKWPASPLLHEAAEFLADESAESFWALARSWQAPHADAADACSAALLTQASAFLTPAMSKVLNLSLALRQYSPRLEAFSHLAAAETAPADACCWVSLRGQVVTNPAEIPAAVTSALGRPPSRGPGLLSIDHIHSSAAWRGVPPNTSDSTLVHAVMYAPIGAACAAPMDAALNAAATAEPRLVYAWRPLANAKCGGVCGNLGAGGALSLHGYGVELAIKNMEYNARDDTAAPAVEEPLPDGAAAGEAAFQFDSLLGDKPELRRELLALQDRLAGAAASGEAPKVKDLNEIGMQAAQRLVDTSDPLHVLVEVAQNFPLLVGELSEGSVSAGVRDTAEKLAQHLPQGTAFVLLNGVPYDTSDFNLYDFVDAVRREVRLMDALAAAGLPPQAARQAAALRGTEAATGGGSDALRLDFRPNADNGEVVWVNDLEVDPEYRSMPRSLMGLLQPGFMGQMPMVRRNVFTAFMAFHPASPHAISAAAVVGGMMQQRFPVRFGLVPVVKDISPGAASSSSEKAARLFAAVAQTHGGRAAIDFLNYCASALPPAALELKSDAEFAEKLWPVAQQAFKARWGEWGKVRSLISPADALAGALAGTGQVGEAALRLLRNSRALTDRKGVTDGVSSGGTVILNGVVGVMEEGGGGWRQLLGGLWQAEMQSVVEDVYRGKLKDSSTDLYADILEKRGTVPRHNPRVLPTGPRNRRVLRLNAVADSDAPPRQVALAGPYLGPVALAALPLRYFGPFKDAAAEETAESSAVDDYADEDGSSSSSSGPQPTAAMITHWVIADATSAAGLQLLADALQHESATSRVGLLLNPRVSAAALAPVEKLVVAVAVGALHAGSRVDLVDLFVDLAAAAARFPGTELSWDRITKEMPEGLNAAGTGAAALLEPLAPQIAAAAAAHETLLRHGLSLQPGTSAVVTNGRVLELRGAGDMVQEDFELLDIGAAKFQFAGADLARALGGGAFADDSATATAAAIVSSCLSAYQPEEVNFNVKALLRLMDTYRASPLLVTSPSSLHPFPADPSPLVIQAVLDPLTKTTQQVAPVLSALRIALNPDLEVLLNPGRGYKDLPLKTFYRYVVPDVTAALSPGAAPPAAVFPILPPHQTLTLGMDVPEGWLVEPVAALHDLDNLRLDELPSGEYTAEASFELEALMVAGMCVDATAVSARMWDAAHPRGVQLQLGTPSHPAQVDTLVMSNLGYFQLKAAPGVWEMRLAPGRSAELYTVSAASSEGAGVGGALVAAKGGAVPVAVTSFSDRDLLLALRKDPARMEEDVLDPEGTAKAAQGGAVAAMWSKFAGKKKKPAAEVVPAGADDTIHVFTVASGHMYERLQKIMILSALKRTNNRLKFWFIKNYMSPAMKQFVPIMAREYGFDYEFVTYKWPSWLHKQTEKQRIIWAYKILFLDVLFPLGLKKVIFCDSDQVIRADLRELWELDLGGAPYGYTPFCDTNTEMEGFRFWKQGFWRDHLRGHPYHISALYVVDLERFRSLAAGDRLRVIYDGLSKDPNSLSNLDQDLPNYAQDQVPIHSLPQEWLWCETWCGEASRPNAKTIDLCNNPLTKEPKLQSARRIIKEWPDLNREVQEFTERVEGVLDGRVTEEELRTAPRFMTVLKPMVEGSVRTTGGESAGAAETAEAVEAGGHEEL